MLFHLQVIIIIIKLILFKYYQYIYIENNLISAIEDLQAVESLDERNFVLSETFIRPFREVLLFSILLLS